MLRMSQDGRKETANNFSEEKPVRDATRVLRAGLPAPSQGEPFLPGPAFVGPYHLSGDPASSAYTHGRYHNPTWTLYEQALGDSVTRQARNLSLLLPLPSREAASGWQQPGGWLRLTNGIYIRLESET